MNERIYKYELAPVPETAILMPEHARILTVATVKGDVFIYAEVNPGNARKLRTFRVCLTGDDLAAPRGCKLVYIGTFILADSNFVVHLYEVQLY